MGEGEFTAAGLTAGKEYGCAILAKSGGYVMGGDVFAFPKPKDAATAKAQLALARVMLDPETQIKFAQKKGSIPIRIDLESGALDVCAQQAMKMLADKSQQVPAQEMLTSPALTGAVEDVISQYWNNPSQTADAFVGRFAAALGQQF